MTIPYIDSRLKYLVYELLPVYVYIKKLFGKKNKPIAENRELLKRKKTKR